jgi:hypothetical protein
MVEKTQGLRYQAFSVRKSLTRDPEELWSERSEVPWTPLGAEGAAQ